MSLKYALAAEPHTPPSDPSFGKLIFRKAAAQNKLGMYKEALQTLTQIDINNNKFLIMEKKKATDALKKMEKETDKEM